METDYYNGIALFYEYLRYNLGDIKAYSKHIEQEPYINYAIGSFIAIFFTSNKENIVDRKESNNFSSKIIDEELAKSIMMIAEYKNDKYYIGDYSEENPANIIALIRNKFAHGEYEIDPINNKITLFRNNTNIVIDISKLSLLIYSAIGSLIKSPKTDKIVRVHPQNRKYRDLGIKQIRNKDDIRLFIKTSFIKEYTLYTYDKSYIEEDVLDAFYRYVEGIRTIVDDEEKINFLTKKFNILANKEKKNLMITKTRIKDNEMEPIVNILDNDKNFYNLDLYNQARCILTLMCEYKYPEYQKEGYLGGVVANLSLLNRMKRKHIYNFDNLLEIKPEIKYNEVLEQSIVSTLVAKFNSIFIYPLERKYVTSFYKLDRSEELDFALLDLDIIKPKSITIYKPPLEEITKKYDSKVNDLIRLKKFMTKLENSLNTAKMKNNQKGINYLENEIRNKRIELVEFLNEFKQIEEEYKNIKRDYSMNSKYFYNRAIIEGIRNSIAHGNVRIKKFISSGSIDDTIINFKDIYEGVITFEADITIKEFESIFNKNNLNTLVEVLDKDDKIYKKSND